MRDVYYRLVHENIEPYAGERNFPVKMENTNKIWEFLEAVKTKNVEISNSIGTFVQHGSSVGSNQ